MEIPIGMAFNRIDAFILIMVRMTGLFVMAPIFGRRNIPAYFKIGFSFMLALILANTVQNPNVHMYENFYTYAVLVLKEFIVGLTIGYVAYLVFTGIYMAGQIIDMQVGFGMVNVLDPVSNIQVPITSNFYFIIAMLVFLGVKGHHLLITALFNSYQYIPLGGAVFGGGLLDSITRVFGNIFVTGFKIAAPIIAAILITDIVLGVISKSVPQLNVFVVGMPLKILMGLLVMVIIVPMFIAFVNFLIEGMNSEVLHFIREMGPG